MRLPVTTAVLAAVAIAYGATASAQTLALLETPRYCARYTDGSTNCWFYTRAQCQAAVSGVGGYCQISPYGDIDSEAQASARRVTPRR